MAKDPAFLFYPGDWLGGTMGMTFEEKGAYIELLILQFNRGHMTSHIIGQTIGQLWVNIKDKFIQDNKGLFYNERLEKEQIKRKSFTDSRLNNLKGVNQYTKKTGHKGGHTSTRMEDEDEDEDKDIKEIKNEDEKELKLESVLFEDCEFGNTYLDFLEHRKKIKKPMTKIGERRLVLKLEKLSKKDSESANEILNESIINGWAGVFELKSNKSVFKEKRISKQQAVYHKPVVTKTKKDQEEIGDIIKDALKTTSGYYKPIG